MSGSKRAPSTRAADRAAEEASKDTIAQLTAELDVMRTYSDNTRKQFAANWAENSMLRAEVKKYIAIISELTKKSQQLIADKLEAVWEKEAQKMDAEELRQQVVELQERNDELEDANEHLQSLLDARQLASAAGGGGGGAAATAVQAVDLDADTETEDD